MQLPLESSTQQISLVISQVTAPAFLLSAVASLLSVLSARMSRVVDRSRAISGLAATDPRRPGLEGELPELRRRANFIHRAIYWSVGSGICACFLVISAFASALLDISHEHGAALLFIFSMGLFTASLVYLAREVRCSASDIDRLE
ncbi:DUF2721 domain-containing protein [uncultured Rhodoblastus sp.]|uniref:DUF2721 domain-containing protein n=1 Tax=uncultured Rhodoblastus sp. TaxID=543037 RepID=UPI0025DF18A6|nr:DUF2721 domain-containing protein [uncultured Rhodoblastus sp.]